LLQEVINVGAIGLPTFPGKKQKMKKINDESIGTAREK
jgi:hypothetical protein